MKRCFLDANVIFTAVHNADGNGRALFRLAAQSRVVLVSSPYALEEAARNIVVKYPERAGDLEALSRILAVVDEPGRVQLELAESYGLPAKDVPILAAAIASGATLLVTGDHRDFGKLFGKTIEGVTVVTPAEALSRILASR